MFYVTEYVKILTERGLALFKKCLAFLKVAGKGSLVELEPFPHQRGRRLSE